MPYTVYFTGLVCLIDDVANDSFIAAIPDGIGDGSGVPDPNDPFNTSKKLPVHRPLLIVRLEDNPQTTNWPAMMITSGLAFFEIDKFARLSLQQASSGGIDATDFRDHAYRWVDIDPAFEIQTRPPAKAFAWTVIERGILRAFQHPSGDAMIAQADIPIDNDSLPIVIASHDGTTQRSMQVKNTAEIVVANVSDDYVSGTGGDGPEDFFIYYTLNEGGKAPKPNVPKKKSLPIAKTRHPFLDRQRDLHVSCSPTLYP